MLVLSGLKDRKKVLFSVLCLWGDFSLALMVMLKGVSIILRSLYMCECNKHVSLDSLLLENSFGVIVRGLELLLELLRERY